jgi:hypothetical protein
VLVEERGRRPRSRASGLRRSPGRRTFPRMLGGEAEEGCKPEKRCNFHSLLQALEPRMLSPPRGGAVVERGRHVFESRARR